MTKLVWADVGERLFEAGVDRGVLYLSDRPGVSWNGLISVTETPSGSEESFIYVDGQKKRNRRSPAGFQATIEAFMYPEEFSEYDGYSSAGAGEQRRKPFDFSYRTLIGNDISGLDHGYKLHLVYGAIASPSSKNYQTFADKVDPINFSWDISTIQNPLLGYRPTAHLVVDSTSAYPAALAELEELLYGSDDDTIQARMPPIEEVVALFERHAILKVTNLGDGLYEIEGPDEAVAQVGSNLYEINWPSVLRIDGPLYSIQSL